MTQHSKNTKKLISDFCYDWITESESIGMCVLVRSVCFFKEGMAVSQSGFWVSEERQRSTNNSLFFVFLVSRAHDVLDSFIASCPISLASLDCAFYKSPGEFGRVLRWKVTLVMVTRPHLVMLVVPYINFFNYKRLSLYCPCRDWGAVYLALFHLSGF